jgi:hypothetical protein
MIGFVGKGVSFYELIRYVLEDKKELSEEQKLERSRQEQLQHKERAEVLEFHLCWGQKNQLTEQFIDVMKLNKRVEKPALHISLRLAPGDVLTRNQLIDIGRECANEFGVSDHQYIAVLHKDTQEQHIHIAANRVGFDGKVASDSNNYKRMAELCRRLEKQYNLQEVLSPRKFQLPQDRLLPRHDSRKERLKTDIRQTLEKVNTYTGFEQQMKALGYKIIKGRGICFIDDKKVKIKGSEVGFSLAKIEKVLSLKEQLTALENSNRPAPSPYVSDSGGNYSSNKTGWDTLRMQRELSGLLRQLLQPGEDSNNMDFALQQPTYRKKKKRGQGL